MTAPPGLEESEARPAHPRLPSGGIDEHAAWGQLLEQLDPRHQVLFFKRLKETGPQSLMDLAPLYYGFMSEFHELLFT